MKSLVRNLVLVASSALALGVAVPAYACGGPDCDHCPHHKAASTDGEKAAAPVPGPVNTPEATSDSKCHCEKGGKGCICPPGKCDCENCGKGKKGA